MRNVNVSRTAQRSLFSQDLTNEKSNQIGSVPAAGVTNYLKTREALWRMLATYPKSMPIQDAVRRARVDFTKCRKEVAA